MAEESLTLRDWAGCVIRVTEGGGNVDFESQDGSFASVVLEAPGQVLLTLIDGRGIDQLHCCFAFGSPFDPAVAPPGFKMLEHVDDERKRVYLADFSGEPATVPFSLVLKQYMANRSTVTT